MPQTQWASESLHKLCQRHSCKYLLQALQHAVVEFCLAHSVNESNLISVWTCIFSVIWVIVGTYHNARLHEEEQKQQISALCRPEVVVWIINYHTETMILCHSSPVSMDIVHQCLAVQPFFFICSSVWMLPLFTVSSCVGVNTSLGLN